MNHIDLQRTFELASVDPTQQAFLCALSGGLDSVVLFDLVSRIAPNVRCVHVNHGMHAQASEWVAFCKQLCANKNIPLAVHSLSHAPTTNIEANLRFARREIFARELKSEEMLLLAHHADDQMETFFLRLMRGAGAQGLGAMNDGVVGFARGYLFRPLLNTARVDIRRYAENNTLKWIDDPSNEDVQFDRNYWRHRISPHVNARWPSAVDAIGRTSTLLRETAQLCRALAQQDLVLGTDLTRIDFSTLSQMPVPRVTNAIRYWLDQLDVKPPNHDRLVEAVRQFLQAAPDRHPSVLWEGGSITRYRCELIFCDTNELSGDVVEYVRKPALTEQWLNLGSLGVVRLLSDVGRGVNDNSLNHGLSNSAHNRLSKAKFEAADFTWGGRCPGARILRSSGHHQTLKNWFQENGVEPLARKRTPMLYWKQQIIAIADLWVDHRFRAAEGESAWYIEWAPTSKVHRE